MTNPYEIPIAPTTLMCGWCEGLGIRTDSECMEYECAGCNGAGMVQKGRDDDE